MQRRSIPSHRSPELGRRTARARPSARAFLHVQGLLASAGRDRHTAHCVRDLIEGDPDRTEGNGRHPSPDECFGLVAPRPAPGPGGGRHRRIRSAHRREEQGWCRKQRGGARELIGETNARLGLRVDAACRSRNGVATGGPGTQRPDPQHRRSPRRHVHHVGGAPHSCRAQPGRHRPLPRLPPSHHGRTGLAVPSVGDRQGDGAAPRRRRALLTAAPASADPAAGVPEVRSSPALFVHRSGPSEHDPSDRPDLHVTDRQGCLVKGLRGHAWHGGR